MPSNNDDILDKREERDAECMGIPYKTVKRGLGGGIIAGGVASYMIYRDSGGFPSYTGSSNAMNIAAEYLSENPEEVVDTSQNALNIFSSLF